MPLWASRPSPLVTPAHNVRRVGRQPLKHARRAISIDTARTAVIVVDMQNDFGSKSGMFDRAGIDISGIQKAVAPTAHVLAIARDAGIRVVYLKMAYQPDLSDLGDPRLRQSSSSPTAWGWTRRRGARWLPKSYTHSGYVEL